MSAATELRALLIASSPVAALVGQKIRFERAEETDPLPYVVLTLSDVERDQALDGSVGGSKSIFRAQCFAATRSTCDAVADAVAVACLADHRFIAGPEGDYIPDLDIEVATVTVDWWDD